MTSQPLLSEQAAFAKHLFTQGYPLWNPDPNLLPQARQRVGLKIGDVGTVDERGRFDFFFNILEPPLPGNAGPPPTQIERDDGRCDDEDLLPRQVVSSPETPWTVDQIELEVLDAPGVTRRTTDFGATLSNDGAHIILPQGAQSFELGLHNRRLFERYAREHGADWLEDFKDHLGWPRSNSIYLLTGFYKTCSWSIASFSMRTAANTDPVRVHCDLVEVDERTIREASVWQPAGRFKCKIGPPPDRQGQNNQTIFIRAITVTPNLSKQKPDGQQEVGLLGRLFSLALSLNPLAGEPSQATATETPENNVIIQHVPQISQASHPSEIINRYLLTKEPSANIAVTHDNQWIAMLRSVEGGQSWTLEDLENHLEALVPVHYSIATHKDTVYLRDKEHGPPSHSGVDRLLRPSGLASVTVSDNKKPRAQGSFGDRQHVPDTPRVSNKLSDVSVQNYFIYKDTSSASFGITTKNVILFGETGVGKSSVINLMAGRDVTSASFSLPGCTLNAQEYSFMLSNSMTLLRIFDTVGLNELEMGLNTFMGAIENARKLLMLLGKAGGIDLLLFCIKAGRLTAATQQNYCLFSEILCNNQVPLALVITHLESEDIMEDWWVRNEQNFQKLGVHAVAHACITAVPAHITRYTTKRDQSLEALQKLFHDALSSHNPPYIRDVQDWLTTFVEKFRAPLTSSKFLKKKQIVKQLEARCALPRSEAQKLAEIIVGKQG